MLSIGHMILCAGLFSTSDESDTARSMTEDRFPVATVQLRSGRDLDANVTAICEHIRNCGASGVRLVVFPECAVTGYFEETATQVTAEQLADAEQRIAAACRASGAAAIVGSPWREGDALYNSALVFDGTGRVIERYHKVQLAESWPDPGDHLSVFPIDGVPCSVIICHDERYPELVRLPVLAGARVIIYISHESGIRQERKIAPYRAQIQARAVENSVFVVQANAPANDDLSGSHGQSRIIDPDGTILSEASMFEEEVLTATLVPSRANAALALRSLQSGPLRDWWQAGLERVRIIRPDEGQPAANTEVPAADGNE